MSADKNLDSFAVLRLQGDGVRTRYAQAHSIPTASDTDALHRVLCC
jgi:hypothetical protein